MLGASLANGGRSREALECYQAALDIDPGYIRALFNTGVSKIKLCEYSEAVAFLVDALRLQSTAELPGQRTVGGTSQNLWHTLESACI